MQAFMPQKDTALALARVARSFISSYTEDTGGKGLLIPRFPLYALLDEPGKSFSSCRIAAPEQDGGQFFFPVRLAHADGTVQELRIVFAELEKPEEGCKPPLPSLPELPRRAYEGEELFPLCPRVFRTGRIEFCGGSWEVWDERWHKLPARQ